MPSTEQPRIRRRSLAEVVESIETSANPMQAMLEQTLAHLRERDPELAEVVRAAAIPHLLDAELLGALRGKTTDNERLLQGLRGLSFARSSADGPCLFDEEMRAWILQEWRSDPDRAEEFQRLNKALVACYAKRAERARRLEQDLERVKDLLLRTAPARFVQLASEIEQQMKLPLLEAMYHEGLVSVEAVAAFFTRTFQAAENEGRHTLNVALLEAAQEALQAWPESEERAKQLQWLRYYDARLQRSLGRWAASEKILQTLLAETAEDVTLQLWTLGELGSAHQQQYQLREARSCYTRELELKIAKQADLYNLPVTHLRLASLHWALGDLEEAVEQYEAAIVSAQRADIQRPDMEAFARLNLGSVHFEMGQWEAAFDLMLEALHLARMSFPQDRAMALSVDCELMRVVARRDPALLDVLHEETLGLLGAAANSPQELPLIRHYQELLRDTGRLGEADLVLKRLQHRFASAVETTEFTDLLLAEALLLEEYGRLEEAIAVYQKIIARAASGRSTTPWHQGAATSNHGLNLATLGRLDEAEAQLQPAIERWKEIGAEKLAAFVQTFLANALRRHGNPVRAQALLQEAAATLERGPVIYRALVAYTQGEVAYALAQWEEAREQHLRAVALYTSIGQHKNTARSHSHLARIASRQGRWLEAADHAAQASSLWQFLTARERLVLSPQLRHAAFCNASGLQRFTEASTTRVEQNQLAAECFREAAEQAPTQFWYPLNLAFACAASSDWPAAIAALEEAHARAPVWARSPLFHGWLAEFHLRQGEKLAALGDAPSAASSFSHSRELLRHAHRPSRFSTQRPAMLHLQLGTGFLKLENFTDAGAEFRAGLELLEAGTSQALRASLHARLALVLAGLGESAEVTAAEFTRSLEAFRASGAEDPAAALEKECAFLDGDSSASRALAGFLRQRDAVHGERAEEQQQQAQRSPNEA